MTQDEPHDASTPTQRTITGNRRIVAVLIVVALFAGVLVAKAMTGRGDVAGVPAAGQAQTAADGASITSVRNDALADYEAALTRGKPIYVLFHSLTCQPCVDISAVADGVLPEYEDEVVFVNAITDDASAQQLASRFQFQYIPTSFFLAPDGTVVDSFTGAMGESDMRARLDALVAKQ